MQHAFHIFRDISSHLSQSAGLGFYENIVINIDRESDLN